MNRICQWRHEAREQSDYTLKMGHSRLRALLRIASCGDMPSRLWLSARMRQLQQA